MSYASALPNTQSVRGPKQFGLLSLPEVQRMRTLELVLPVVPISSGMPRIAEKATGYVLPPLFRELVRDEEIEEIAETIREQLPFLNRRSKTIVHVLHCDAVDEPRITPGACALFSTDPIEQHGPHLDLMTDIRISSALVDGLAAEDETLVTFPGVAYGSLRWALALGASVSIREGLHEQMLRRYVEWLGDHGFERVAILSTHLAQNHLRTISRVKDWGKEQSIHLTPLAPLSYIRAVEHDPHAGYVETALSEHLGADVAYEALPGLGDFPRPLTRETVEILCGPDLAEFQRRAAGEGWSGIVCEDSAYRACIESSRKDLFENGRLLFRRLLNECQQRLREA